MTNKVSVRNYTFDTSQLTGENPYNNHKGEPVTEFLEQSYAWCEAAYIYRCSKKSENEIISYYNFGD